jgi:hypothetical protein
MSDESSPSSGGTTPPPRTEQEAAMEALRSIGAGEAEMPSTLAEAKASVASLQTPGPPTSQHVSPPTTNPSILTSVAAPDATPITARHRYRRQLGRLKGVAIKNYRAFRGPFTLDLPAGENALIYGENGAGKSSLFHTIRDFFEAPHRHFRARSSPEDEGVLRALGIADNQHRPKVGEPSVELNFQYGTYGWNAALESDGKRSELATPWNAVITATDKVKGFLDYRALLRVHYLAGEPGQRIDVFSLLLYQLLPHYTYSQPGSWFDSVTKQWRTGERSFSQGWADLQRRFGERLGHHLYEEFKPARKGFDEALKLQVETHLAARASAFARRFDPMLNIAFKVVPSLECYSPRKHLEPPKVYLYVLPSGDIGQVIDYDRFFNEARLTAIALAIFFAALLESPATGKDRLLALDDILIGLDMANRLAVLRIVEEHFKDWQILIFTYHKAWFEILKERTASKIWQHKWKSFIVRQEQVLNTKTTIVRADESAQMLELATRYAKSGEYKSAAVHARTAMEIILARFCARKRLLVCYVQDGNRQTNLHFLSAIHLWLSRLRSPRRFAVWEELFSELKHSLRFVLHSFSHNSPEREDELEGEVATAIRTVRQLEEFLKSVREGELAHDPVPSRCRTFEWLIEDALTSPIPVRQSEALRSLGHATESFLLKELPARGVVVRLLDQGDLWRLLFRSGKLTKEERKSLGEMRPYLGGNVTKAEFNEGSFITAARFLLQMRLLTILRNRKASRRVITGFGV